MSAEEFSGLPFALGVVRGFRAWGLTVDGVLRGISYKDDWMPGENHAICHAYPSKEVVPTRQEDEDYLAYNERVRLWKGGHDMADCKHGFYGYFADSDDKAHTNGMKVRGIIEGFGETFIGTKGFRAMKARILAVSFQPLDGMWRLEPMFQERLRQNYPGIALFESDLAMLAEFPADRLAEIESTAVQS